MCVHAETCGTQLALEHNGDQYSLTTTSNGYLLGNIGARVLLELCPSATTHHVSEPMRQMAALLRAGRAPADLIAAYVAADSQRRRNERCPCGSGRKWKRCHGTEPDRV